MIVLKALCFIRKTAPLCLITFTEEFSMISVQIKGCTSTKDINSDKKDESDDLKKKVNFCLRSSLWLIFDLYMWINVYISSSNLRRKYSHVTNKHCKKIIYISYEIQLLASWVFIMDEVACNYQPKCIWLWVKYNFYSI